MNNNGSFEFCRWGFWTGIIAMMILFTVPGWGREQAQLDSYQSMRARLGELYNQKKYQEAAELLDLALLRFPEHVLANSYNLAIMCAHLQDYERGVKALLYGLERGVWFGLYDFGMELWEPYRGRRSFQDFLERNRAIRNEVQKTARPLLKVEKPGDYDPQQTYPLFIALHGGGENMQEFSRQWTSDKLKSEFLVVYLQSSQVVSMDGFGWTEDIDLAKQEIQAAFEQLRQDLPVDEERVFVGGFSSGGVASLVVSMEETVPAKGFVVLCPGRPEGFSVERVKEAAGRGLRGTLLTTEMDRRLEDQKAMARTFAEQGLECELIITPDIGHWYPEDLGEQIDRALVRLLEK